MKPNHHYVIQVMLDLVRYYLQHRHSDLELARLRVRELANAIRALKEDSFH